MYTTKSPVLLLVFNRVDTLRQVLARVAVVKPAKLYIAADGPRKNKPGEAEKVKAVRNFLRENITWDCEIKSLYRSENMGCRLAVSSAISWFFEQEEAGIVLEDDCLPNESFFRFCDVMLDKYRDDERVMHISGSNHQHGVVFGDASFYFSNCCHVWGWASWRRAWQAYDLDMKDLPVMLERQLLDGLGWDAKGKKFWSDIFLRVKNGEIDTWDYQWLYSIWKNRGMGIIPNTNMIVNVGFGEDATHTKDANSRYSNISAAEMKDITFPSIMMTDVVADNHSLLLEIKEGTLAKRIKRKIMRMLAKAG